MPASKNWLIRGSLIAIAAGTSTPALAQQREPAAASDQAASEGEAMGGEIIVTAQRRAQLLEDVPMAVQVITPEAIQNSGVRNFMDLGNIAVGARFEYNGTVPTVTLRGITSSISGYSAEPNVAVYVDGMYDSQPVTLAADLSNVQSVQILKGPQGTLYGRNATGGAMLIQTRGPTDILTSSFDVSYERFDRVGANGFVAGPLSDSVRASIAASYRHGDLSLRRSDPNVVGRTIGAADTFEHANIRAKLEVDVTENLTVQLTYNHSEIADSRANYFTPYEHRPATYPAPPVSAPVTAFGVVSNDFPSEFLGKLDQYIAKLEWQTGIGTLTSYSGYATRDIRVALDFDGSYAPLTALSDDLYQKTWQQSVDFAINAVDRLALNIGGIYFKDSLYSGRGGNTSAVFSGGNLIARTDRDNFTEAWAVYIDGTYEVTDRLSINLGGRFSHDTKRFTYASFRGDGTVNVPFIEDERSWNAFTPRATVRYEFAPRTNVYASVSEGFRAGNFGPQGPVSSGPGLPAQLLAAEPEKITAYEVGFKTAGRKLRFSAAAFYYDYTNLQVTVSTQLTLGPGQSPVAVLQNSKGAIIKGAEAEISFNPIENLTLRGGISVIDAYYTDFKNWIGTPVNATNTTNGPVEIQDISGKELVRAPDYSGTVGFDYELPTSVGTFLLTSTLRFTDSFVVSNPSLYGSTAPVELRDKQRLRQGAYSTLSAQLKWTDPHDHMSIALFGDNLTDTSYRLSYNTGGFGDYAAKADPATYGVRLGYKF